MTRTGGDFKNKRGARTFPPSPSTQQSQPRKFSIGEKEEKKEEVKPTTPIPQTPTLTSTPKNIDIKKIRNQAFDEMNIDLAKDDPLLYFLSQQLQITDSYKGMAQELKDVQKDQLENAEKILQISNQFSINLDNSISKISTDHVVKKFQELYDVTINKLQKENKKVLENLQEIKDERDSQIQEYENVVSKLHKIAVDIPTQLEGLKSKVVWVSSLVSFGVGVLITTVFFLMLLNSELSKYPQ